MILFLNFAPIEFMGGAEKWMLEMSAYVNKTQEVYLVDINEKIANIYGRIALNRRFDKKIDKHITIDQPKRKTLGWKDFVPFTKQWYETRKLFSEAELIYMRFEILEIMIGTYFGGSSILHKTIAGLHLTIKYASPRGIFDRFHNLFYTSIIYKHLLSQVKKVHVINKRDESYLLNDIKLNNVVYLPNGTDVPVTLGQTKTSSNYLEIIYVGELSTRKGVDTVVEIINQAPQQFLFNIVGDGPLKESIQTTVSLHNNCKYYDYVSSDTLNKLYSQSDVLLFPSRAEAFGLVMIEALAHGLMVLNSSEVRLDLPGSMECTIDVRNPTKYIEALHSILKLKKNKKIAREVLHDYIHRHFSKSHINKKFLNNIIK